MAPPLAIHIGYHKTGTTWFQREILPRHPQLVAYLDGPPDRDPFLRALITTHDARWDPTAARALLDARLAALATSAPGATVVLSAERISGHIATGGSDAHRSARRLAQVAPEAKVWFVQRDPQALLASEYRQLVGEGYPGTLARLRGGDRWKTTGFDDAYYDFAALETAYAEGFGHDRVRVWEYEAFVADRARFLDELAAFLDVNPWSVPDSVLRRVVHPGVPESAVPLLRLLNRVRRSELNSAPLVSIGDWWRRPVIRLARAGERVRRRAAR